MNLKTLHQPSSFRVPLRRGAIMADKKMACMFVLTGGTIGIHESNNQFL